MFVVSDLTDIFLPTVVEDLVVNLSECSEMVDILLDSLFFLREFNHMGLLSGDGVGESLHFQCE